MVSMGAAGSAILLALGILMPVPLVPVVIFGLAGALPIARAHVRQNRRVLVTLEQVLDRLEHGEIRPAALPGASPRDNPLARIAIEIRKTFDI
jgi:hypothetical protein